jgi:hypothetical protein
VAELPSLVARFAHESSRFNSAGPTWKCFEPARLDHATSVFAIDGLNDDSIWAVGDQWVQVNGQTPIARADLESSKVGVSNAGYRLRLEMDDSPPGHGAITGWPPWEEKEQIRLLAKLLAQESRLVKRT